MLPVGTTVIYFLSCICNISTNEFTVVSPSETECSSSDLSLMTFSVSLLSVDKTYLWFIKPDVRYKTI